VKHIGRHIVIFFFLIQSTHAQVKLQKEEMIEGKYRLVYSNDGYSCSVNENNGKRYLSFSGADNKKEDQFLPAQNLIIALPPNSHPAITVTVTKRQQLSLDKIEHLPAFDKELYSVKGYLWIDNYYCVHIVVNPFYFDKTTGQVAEIREFYVDVGMPQSVVADARPNKSSASHAIDNPKFGSQWKSKQLSDPIAQTDSWIDYTADYVKLGVAKDGIYRLRYDDLLAYGVPVASLNPRAFKIYLKGKEIPIYVYGESDTRFDQGGYIEFLGRRNYGDVRYREVAPYGSSYYEYLNLYSDTTIYWLNWSGSFGRRIDTVITISGTPTDTVSYYDELIHSERNLYWDFSLNGGDVRRNDPEILENETWGEGDFSVGKLSVPFSVSDLYPDKPARAFVKLQDYSSDIQTNAHDLALSINNTAPTYNSGFINKYQVKILKANFPSSILSNGTNTVDLHSSATANSINKVYRDWYELEYPRHLKTLNDSLNFAYNNLTSQTVAALSITGLSANTLSLYKFQLQDSSVTKITNFVRSVDTLRFVDTVVNGTYYFLLREDEIPTPIFFYKKKFTNLRSKANKADYIAITHPSFNSVALTYVSFIASQYGVAAKLIDIFDIYDEFNYGFFAPEPIREFLKSTHLYWQLPQPKHVLLIGKGTYDFYGNKARYFGAPTTPNFVPPYGNPVSDTWFVQWDSTGSLIPQMNIGRIPAKNIDEFQSYVVKHQKYVSKGFDDWNKRFLFFAGGTSTDPSQIAQCKGVNDFIITNYASKPPLGGLVFNFYKTENPFTNFGPYSQDYVKNAIDQGGVFICYIGHSGTETWDNGIADISQLSNIRDRNPMISDFGCSTGKFAEADVVSFSEFAVNGLQGQAISYIGNSSLGFTSTAFSFPQVFYKKLLIDTSASLGDVHRLAKIDYIKQFGTSDAYGLFIKTNTLIGDPIVKLPIPVKPNYSFSNTVISVTPQQPTEQIDSVLISLDYFNLGAVVGDSIEFLATDSYQGNAILSCTLKRATPLFSDSLLIYISVKGKPGEHIVTITADPLNRINEIYKNDNSIVYHLFVASSNIRSTSLTTVSNQTKGKILFLNPTVRPLQSQFLVDLSLRPTFDQSQSYSVPFDTFYTPFALDTIYKGKRVWLRPRYDQTNLEGLTYSYFVGEKENYLLNDSDSFSPVTKNKLKILQNKLVLDTSKIIFSAISAGFNDGRTAVISRDGQNFIPVSYQRGHHVCLFNATTLEFVNYYLFDIRDDPSIAAPYKAFLDTLASDYIVVIAVAEEGELNLTPELKTAIKTLGSIYIDSLVYRGSWAIIGRKGSAPGSVPEKYSQPFAGRVQIDTSFVVPNKSGSLVTSQIGPVAQWKSLEVSQSTPSSSQLKFRPLGIRKEGIIDTLNYLSLVNNNADISFINANLYPKIQVLGEFTAGSDGSSPTLGQLGVNYVGIPELGTNYQVVQTNKIEVATNRLSKSSAISSTDSILQGELLGVKARVYNVGESKAETVRVKANVVWPNRDLEELGTLTIDSIPPLGYKEVSFTYNSSAGFGNRTFQIFIDPDNRISELYKDNNYYSIPFVVLRDSLRPQLVEVLFDGSHIQNGDYVSANTTIDISVRDEGALSIYDTSTVAITLDEKRIYYNQNQSLSLLPGNTTRELTVRFRPDLDKGEHQLGLNVKDRSGNFYDSTEKVITFTVDPQLRVEELYNYPNPFATQSYFAFKLTQVPEELQIKIYTVAGRLIKVIKLTSADLTFGFNKIYWDGRDGDGDEIANGVYLYRLIAKGANQQVALTQKLVKMR
jgi:hypothetical protein